jgi:hypothetical protein
MAMRYLRVDQLFPADLPARLLLRICGPEFVCWISKCGGGPESGPKKYRMDTTWGFLTECCNRVGNRLLYVIHVRLLRAHVSSYVIFLSFYRTYCNGFLSSLRALVFSFKCVLILCLGRGSADGLFCHDSGGIQAGQQWPCTEEEQFAHHFARAFSPAFACAHVFARAQAALA